MVEIFLLEQLAAFARWGTLTQAAEQLHITQPALSRSMRKLEQEFGVPLFTRSKSKIALNETGQVAAQYAQRVLEADREMVERTVAFDRSRRTIVLGACASFPINLLLPVLQEWFPGMAIISELNGDENLLAGLRNRAYQLVILHHQPVGEGLFTQPYLEENLCITVPVNHPLADRGFVTFQELDGLSLLAHRNAVFWVELCQRKLPHSKLLAQDSLEILHELVDSSTLPAFSSDRALEWQCSWGDRVAVPIRDKDAHTTYYLACRKEERERFVPVFRAAARQMEQA